VHERRRIGVRSWGVRHFRHENNVGLNEGVLGDRRLKKQKKRFCGGKVQGTRLSSKKSHKGVPNRSGVAGGLSEKNRRVRGAPWGRGIKEAKGGGGSKEETVRSSGMMAGPGNSWGAAGRN